MAAARCRRLPLDVADELPDDFIEKIRAAVKRVSPEKFLLGEVWEDATTKYGFGQRRTYLLGKGLDSVMNYPFKNAVLDFVKGKPAEQAMGEILSICEHYPAPAMDTALNFLSTHDTELALTVIADEPANGRGREWQSGRCVTGDAYEEGLLRLRMAYAIIYTLPGVPCLYYGDEIAMQGYRDPSTGLSSGGMPTSSACALCWHNWHSSATPAKPSAPASCGFCVPRTASCTTSGWARWKLRRSSSTAPSISSWRPLPAARAPR